MKLLRRAYLLLVLAAFLAFPFLFRRWIPAYGDVAGPVIRITLATAAAVLASVAAGLALNGVVRLGAGHPFLTRLDVGLPLALVGLHAVAVLLAWTSAAGLGQGWCWAVLPHLEVSVGWLSPVLFAAYLAWAYRHDHA